METQVSNTWMRLAGLKVKNPRVNHKSPRAKKSKQELIDLATEYGMAIKFNLYGHNQHAIMKDGDGVHWAYGFCDVCSNLYEIENCIDDYIKENERN